MDLKPSTSITVRGSFHFGKDTVEFEMTSFASVGTEEFETQRLAQLVVNGRKQFIDTLAHTLTPVQTVEETSILNPTWAKVELVSKTLDRGKVYIKAHYGRFLQHGVVMWKEVLERADIYPDQIPDAPFKPECMAILWGMDANNKPRIERVVTGDKAKEVLNV